MDETADNRVCPFCAETIKRAAVLCRFCHSTLPPLAARPQAVKPATAPVRTSDFDLEPDPVQVVPMDEDTVSALHAAGVPIADPRVPHWTDQRKERRDEKRTPEQPDTPAAAGPRRGDIIAAIVLAIFLLGLALFKALRG